MSDLTHLRNLGTRVDVPIRPDEQGYVGKECPIPECLGYFKITPGTGITDPAPCHCPYCGHSGEHNTFFTQDQLEYAKSVALRAIAGALEKDFKCLEFEHEPKGMFGIGISLKIQGSAPLPLRHYREKQLETEVTCDSCTLKYAIYGVFGWCPDCAVHNSLQILMKNLELARKELVLAASAEPDLASHLIGDALENAVSALDGFGRKLCASKGADIHFQNLPAARLKVTETFGCDISEALTAADWNAACRIFQKRHLLAHKMGVIDEEYIKRASDPDATFGHKVRISGEEVDSALRLVELIGRRLFVGTLGKRS